MCLNSVSMTWKSCCLVMRRTTELLLQKLSLRVIVHAVAQEVAKVIVHAVAQEVAKVDVKEVATLLVRVLVQGRVSGKDSQHA